ncbi:N-acetylmuramoyl-L-alanine amidase [Desulfitobacterium sp.]|uniref:N-acetylmuramoyl-L-alanine amidase n=1 Tax=Desulfitobacterium sp. TaxID=49981 RepID=UPI002BA8C90E|nr:N-acetylmuramoyl-L-alanine amidase [Desulfitobacterium sp.]HVJ48340.1 N-acetylmuramoyl-L-alanine amidase [Desulfitobacterium sp.]
MRQKRDEWYQQGKHKQLRKRIILGLLVMALLLGGVAWKLYPHDQKSWSWTVGNQTILIDAGHGGVDPGAVGKNNTLEKDITLAVSKRLKVLVQQAGGKAIMVREEDVDLGTAQGLLKRKREDLAQRIQLANDMQADVYLSIHANSFPNEKLTGAQVFYYANSAEGKLLAQCIQEQLNSLTGGKRVAKGNQELFILKKANRAAVTIELGFMSNAGEEQKLNDSNYQQQLAVAVYQGLANYLGKSQNSLPQSP